MLPLVESLALSSALSTQLRTQRHALLNAGHFMAGSKLQGSYAHYRSVANTVRAHYDAKGYRLGQQPDVPAENMTQYHLIETEVEGGIHGVRLDHEKADAISSAIDGQYNVVIVKLTVEPYQLEDKYQHGLSSQASDAQRLVRDVLETERGGHVADVIVIAVSNEVW